jgi:hypothetical protein
MVLGKSGVQQSEKATLLPPNASQRAAGKSPPIQPGQRSEEHGERPGTDQHVHGSHAETDSQETATVEFPLRHAAVGNIGRDKWVLADAILAECSEPGSIGVRTGSYTKMEKMRAEIARNHGVELSLERVRKLRKVASAFPAGRRRPGEASLEAHLEAGTPDELDELIRKTPGTALSVSRIRQAKSPEEKEKAQRQKEDEERRTQTQEKRDGLQEHQDQHHRVSEHLEESSTGPNRRAPGEPTPVSPPAPKKEARGVAEALTEAVRVLVKSHGIDPGAGKVRQAIETFVAAVVPAPAK